MAAERFRLAANIAVRHVPFREGGLMQVMGGNVDFYFIPLAAAASALGSDKLVLLAVSSPKRVALLSNVPSVAELGYPDAVFRFWNGISAPAKTPREIVNKLHDVTETALKDSALREKLTKLGVEPAQMSVAEFGKFFRDDLNATVELARRPAKFNLAPFAEHSCLQRWITLTMNIRPPRIGPQPWDVVRTKLDQSLPFANMRDTPYYRDAVWEQFSKAEYDRRYC